MARDTYQHVSAVQSLLVVHIVQHYLTTPALAYTFVPCADVDFWYPAYTYADLARIPEADYEMGGRKFGIYGHDWRKVPPPAWLALLGEREVGFEAPAREESPREEHLVLSREEFEQAVRAALRGYVRPDTLSGNPLLKTRLVARRSEGRSRAARIEALRAIIKESANQMKASPCDLKLLRAVHYTWITPLPTQEAAAERLDLPFSTYRRHLARGVKRLAEILWELEIGES